MNNQLIIFDTTLRDGEQSPGASLSVSEKVEIAKQLEKLNVDVIEAGFPVSSPEQFDAVERISNEVGITVAALARSKEIDIKAAYDAIKNGEKNRIHTFSSTSDYHILGKFGDDRYGKTLADKRETVIKMSYDMVKYAKTFVDDVEFSAEDAGRTDLNYLVEVIEAAIEAGATTINIPDTTGYTMPKEFGEKIAYLRAKVKNIESIIISVHCHNDLGLAVANSIAGIENGARQIECTVNGIGERAGNASLEEIVMALKVRKDIFDIESKIETKEIMNTSKLVSGYTGIIIQPNKAIVGENAFAHESGIHQDGMLKNRETYEIMTPETVGLQKTKIVLGRHSGRHGLQARLEELGYSLEGDELKKVYDAFTELADKKKEVYDDDLRILMGDSKNRNNAIFTLEYMHVFGGSSTIPTATVRIKTDDEIIEDSATGDGPVDALFNAIDRALDKKPTVESYRVRSVTAGREALGEVSVRIRKDGRSYTGVGVSTDIIEASGKAYIQAINKKERYERSNNKHKKENIKVEI